jgi:hypothetical protein
MQLECGVVGEAPRGLSLRGRQEGVRSISRRIRPRGDDEVQTPAHRPDLTALLRIEHGLAGGWLLRPYRASTSGSVKTRRIKKSAANLVVIALLLFV